MRIFRMCDICKLSWSAREYGELVELENEPCPRCELAKLRALIDVTMAALEQTALTLEQNATALKGGSK